MRFGFICLSFCFAALSNVIGDNNLWIASSAANPGTSEVPVNIYVTHDDPIHAFSLSISFSEEALEFVRLDLDSPGIITGETGYEYKHITVDQENGDIVTGVILDIEEPYQFQEIPASPEEPQVLASLVFNIKVDADPGNYLIQPRNGLGSPPINNVFSSYGYTVAPELEGGTFVVTNPNHLYVKDAKGTAGGMVTVTIEAQHPGPVGGFSFALRYPSDILTIDTDPLDDPNITDPDDPHEEDVCLWPITWCGLGLDQLLSPGGIDTFRAWADPNFQYDDNVPGEGDGWIFSDAIFDYLPPLDPPPLGKHLSPGRQEVLKITFQISEDVSVGDEIPITPINGTGTPPVINTFVIPFPEGLAMSVHPRLHPGKITIIKGFKRGDVNNDGRLDIADSIVMLAYLFVPGNSLSCMKAADINDDGSLDVADPIATLTYIFADGPSPMPPFLECGGDPTPDNLTCDEPNC